MLTENSELISGLEDVGERDSASEQSSLKSSLQSFQSVIAELGPQIEAAEDPAHRPAKAVGKSQNAPVPEEEKMELDDNNLLDDDAAGIASQILIIEPPEPIQREEQHDDSA